MKKFHLTEKQYQQIRKLAEKYGVDLLMLYGSQARGDAHKESDVDVAYASEKKLTFKEELSLDGDLIDVFQNDYVQLVNVQRAPPLLLHLIIRDAVILFERRKGVFEDLLILGLHLYEEAKPLFELRAEYIKKRIAEYGHA